MPIRAKDIASSVLGAVGGRENVVANSTCMTRLRITVIDTTLIDTDALDSFDAVLGCAERGVNGIEVIFGPRMIQPVFEEFSKLTGLPEGIEPLIGSRRPATRLSVHVAPVQPESLDPAAKAPAEQVPEPQSGKTAPSPSPMDAEPELDADEDDAELLAKLTTLFEESED